MSLVCPINGRKEGEQERGREGRRKRGRERGKKKEREGVSEGIREGGRERRSSVWSILVSLRSGHECSIRWRGRNILVAAGHCQN